MTTKKENQYIGITIPKKTLEKIDILVSTSPQYFSRSHFFQMAAETRMYHEENKKEGEYNETNNINQL